MNEVQIGQHQHFFLLCSIPDKQIESSFLSESIKSANKICNQSTYVFSGNLNSLLWTGLFVEAHVVDGVLLLHPEV